MHPSLALSIPPFLTSPSPSPSPSSNTDLMCFGDSAGAYGASVYCAILAERARELNLDINIAVVADSGIGIAAVSPTWGIEKGALAHVRQPLGCWCWCWC